MTAPNGKSCGHKGCSGTVKCLFRAHQPLDGQVRRRSGLELAAQHTTQRQGYTTAMGCRVDEAPGADSCQFIDSKHRRASGQRTQPQGLHEGVPCHTLPSQHHRTMHAASAVEINGIMSCIASRVQGSGFPKQRPALGVAGGVLAQVQAGQREVGERVGVLRVLFVRVLQQLLRLLPVALWHQDAARLTDLQTSCLRQGSGGDMWK